MSEEEEWPDLEVELRPREIAYRVGEGKDQAIFLPDRGLVVRRTGTEAVDPVTMAVGVHLFKNSHRVVPEAELAEIAAAAERKMKMN
jgi:hypothetical protein